MKTTAKPPSGLGKSFWVVFALILACGLLAGLHEFLFLRGNVVVHDSDLEKFDPAIWQRDFMEAKVARLVSKTAGAILMAVLCVHVYVGVRIRNLERRLEEYIQPRQVSGLVQSAQAESS